MWENCSGSKSSLSVSPLRYLIPAPPDTEPGGIESRICWTGISHLVHLQLPSVPHPALSPILFLTFPDASSPWMEDSLELLKLPCLIRRAFISSWHSLFPKAQPRDPQGTSNPLQGQEQEIVWKQRLDFMEFCQVTSRTMRIIWSISRGNL